MCAWSDKELIAYSDDQGSGNISALGTCYPRPSTREYERHWTKLQTQPGDGHHATRFIPIMTVHYSCIVHIGVILNAAAASLTTSLVMLADAVGLSE